MFSKPTDGHLYLRTDSAHPFHCKSSIPFSIASRLKRICSKPEFLRKRFLEFKEYLVNRGYHPDFVQEQFDIVDRVPRNQLLHKAGKNKVTHRKIPLILDFNPALPNISNVLRKNLPLLYSSPAMKEVFPDNSIFPAFRKCKSLKDHFQTTKTCVRSNVNDVNNIKSGCFKCVKSRCDLCANFLDECINFSSVITGKNYVIRDNLTCSSCNVIYLASCLECNVQYVGSTSTPFKVRFRNHKSDMVNNKARCELAVHFNSKPHILSKIRFIIIEQIRSTINVDYMLNKK